METTRCFDIGGSKIVAADVSSFGDVDVLARIPTPLNCYNEFAQALRAHCPPGDGFISISMAGVINPDTRVVQSSNIPGISGRRLAHDLQKSLGRGVFIINDANAFALAESKFGDAKDHDVVFAIILGTGVGGAVVIDGNVLNGCCGTAGEWGHGPASTLRTGHVLPKFLCACCKQACVDTFGGARGMERIYEQVSSEFKSSHDILDAWESGEANAVRVVDVWLDVVGSALANIVNTLGASIVAVGGGLANNVSLISALNDEVNDRRLSESRSQILYSAVSGPEQGLIGASLHAKAIRSMFVST